MPEARNSTAESGTQRKVVRTLLVLGLLAILVAAAVRAAFSSTTSNPNNSFTAGTVTIGDNDADTALYSVSARKPGDFVERCIRVSFSGSLPSTVRLYRSAFTGSTGLASYLDVAITKGTGTQADCGDFSAGANPAGGVYAGTLNAMATTYAAGIALTNAAGGATWSQNDGVTYRIRVTVQDNNAGQGLTTGTHSYIWEAQNA